MSKLLLIDGENLLHRSFHKFKNLSTSDGEPTGAIFGFFKSLNYLAFRFQSDHILVTFDNGHSKYRTQVLPEYKAGRKKISMDYESLQKQKKIIMKILKHLNICYIYDKKRTHTYEGDDYIAWVVQNHKGKSTIVSSDKDFCQLLSKSVKIFNPSKDELITENNCKKHMGYSGDECIDYLSLLGDKSDGIPGYRGLGEVKVRQFLDKWGSISNFLNGIDNTHLGVSRDIIGSLYSTNKLLIDLNYFLKKHKVKELPLVYNKKKSINLEKLHKIFIRYSLTSFRSKEFLSTFEKLEPWQKSCF